MKKAGTIRKRKDGRFEGRFTGPDGRRHYVLAPTHKETLERLRRAMSEAEVRSKPTDGRLTVAAYLERWLETSVRPRCKPTTTASYAETVRRYITPHLGRIALAKLRPEDVRAMLAALATTNLSPTTQRYAYSVLRIALGRAYKDEVILRNVAEMVDPPAKARVTIEPLSLDDTRAFLSSLAETRLGALYTTAIATGLRQGELLALRWDDVDLDRSLLRVRHTLERGTRTLTEPKTAGSVRDVPLSEFAVVALRGWATRQKRDRLAAGPAWEEGGLVFTTPRGRPLDGVNVTHDLQATLERAGLRRQRFHDLRHLNATLMLDAGVPIEVVSRNLGHSSIRTTVDTYGHITDERRRAAAERLDSVLAQGRATSSS